MGLHFRHLPSLNDDKFLFYIFVNTGSVYEDKHVAGIAHLLEHMLFRSSMKYKDGVISKELTRLGKMFNGITDKDLTYYYIHTSDEYWEQAVDILLNIVCDCKFTAEQLAVERNVVIEEVMNVNSERDSVLADLVFESVLDPKDPFIRPIGGTRASINNITAKDLKEFYDAYYKDLSNLTFVTYSKNSHIPKIKKMIRHYTKGFKVGTRHDVPTHTFVPRTITRYNKDIPVKYVCMTFQAFPVQQWEKNVTVEFIAYILANAGLYSILNQEMRATRGLVYGVRMENQFMRDVSLSTIQFNTSHKNVKSIIKLVRKLVTELHLNKETLMFFKESFKNYTILQWSIPENKTLFVGMVAAYGLSEHLTLHNYLAIIDAITTEDIHATIKQVYDFESMGLVIFGS